MLQRLCPVVLNQPIKENQPLHPLHIAVSTEALNEYLDITICPRKGSQFNGALIIDPTSSENIFVTVHVLSTNSVIDNEVLHLHVTEEFLKHYHFYYGQRLFFKLVNCIPISKVIFGARTAESYLWAKSEEWHKDFLLAVCQTKTLCRLHDVLLVSPSAFMLQDSSLLFNLFVVLCEPVEQGILTTFSTVIILDGTDKLVSQALNSELYLSRNDQNNFSNFMNYTKYEKLPEISFELQSEIGDGTSSEERTFSFQICIIPQLDSVFQNALLEVDNVLDPLNTIFIGSEILEVMGIQSGAYVEIQLSPFGSVAESDSPSVIHEEVKVKHRLVTVCPIEGRSISATGGMITFLSPHLWFNLNSHPSKLIQPDYQLLVKPFRFEDDVSEPPYAKEVFVSLIQSPCYNGTISCEAMLKNYFKEPRYICKGDIFCIDTTDAVDFHLKSPDRDNIINRPMVYFRVSMIEGAASHCGYLIDGEHTRLYQAGTAQSYIPATMGAFYSVESDPLFTSPAPNGLNYYVEILEEIIGPILNIQNNCKFQVNSNILLTGAAGSGKTVVVRAICKRLNLHLYHVNCHELLGETSATIEARLATILEKASVYAPCVMLFKNIDFIGKEKELKGENSRVLSSLCELLRNVNRPENEWPVIVIATSTYSKLMSGDLAAAFLHLINIDPPSETERLEMIEGLLKKHLCPINYDVSPEFVALRTAGFVLADLSTLVAEAAKNRYLRLKNLLKPNDDLKFEEDVCLAGFPIIWSDFLSALEKLHSDNAETSGAAKIPNVLWEDIGGLSDVKQEILDTIHLPMEHPEILATGLRRSGILLYGPPGTGKTLLAKAVATECSLNFISIKGPELINMYVGQSEENVRTVFDQARSSVPCVIFFDELDSLAPNRGRSGDSGGVMDRVVSQLLSEIDGLSTTSQVFVIGATNRPDLIDPALLRPGRFDRLVYVGVSEDKKSKLSILKALTRKLKLADDVNLEEIAEDCPPNLSGADLYSLCSDAMMYRIQKNVELVEKGLLKLEDANILIQKEDFKSAMEKVVSSVSEQELARYEELKRRL